MNNELCLKCRGIGHYTKQGKVGVYRNECEDCGGEGYIINDKYKNIKYSTKEIDPMDIQSMKKKTVKRG